MIKENMTLLKGAMPSTPAEICHLLGYNLPGDGGGGDFYWDSASIESDNSGTIIQVTGYNTGRWKRIYNGPVDVRWFGAVGNSTFDNTSIFRNVFNSFNNVMIPTGTYIVKDTITIGVNIHIEGEPDSVILREFEITNTNPTIASVQNVSISLWNLVFNGNRNTLTNEWTSLGQFQNKNSVGIKNDFYYIYFDVVNTVTIRNCIFKEINGTGCVLRNTEKVFVDNCIFIGCDKTGLSTISNGKNIDVTGCTFSDIGYLPDQFTVDGVVKSFNGPEAYHHQFGDGFYSAGNSIFAANNTCVNINRAAFVCENTDQDAGVPAKCILTNNYIEHNHSHLRCNNPFSSIWCELQDRATVTGNRLVYKLRSANEYGYGIMLAQSSFLSINECFNNEIDASAYNNTLPAGIVDLANNNKYSYIKNNVITGDISVPIYITHFTTGYGEMLDISQNNIITQGNSIAGYWGILFEKYNNWAKHYKNINVSGNTIKIADSGSTGIAFSDLLANADSVICIKNNELNNKDIYIGSDPVLKVFIYNNTGCNLIKRGNAIQNGDYIEIIGNSCNNISLNGSPASTVSAISGMIDNNAVNGEIAITACRNFNITGNNVYSNTYGITVNPTIIDIENLIIGNNNIRLNADNTVGINMFIGPSGHSLKACAITGNILTNQYNMKFNNTTGIRWATPSGNTDAILVAGNHFLQLQTNEFNRILNV